jgi:hypothetical protein
VGRFGDPRISWSVLLHAHLHEPVDPAGVEARLARTVAAHPHLGAPPPVVALDAGTFAAFADEHYPDAQPLLRVAVGPADLVIAVHHGATDGLGLLSILGDALDIPVTSAARGIGDRPAATGFVASLARRLAEALFSPPARITPSGGSPPSIGDVLVHANLPARRASTAALIAATAQAVEHWNASRGDPMRRFRGGHRMVVGVGASRRDGSRLSPAADTALVRLRLPARPTVDDVRRALAGTPPEPTVPRSTKGRPWWPVRLLASRLGATFLASNLGVVDAGGHLRSLAFYPTASGRSGVAVGAATVGDTTTITLRARRASFDRAATERLLAAILDDLTRM